MEMHTPFHVLRQTQFDAGERDVGERDVTDLITIWWILLD